MCYGSFICEYILDKENKFLEPLINNITWPPNSEESTIYQKIKALSKNLIVIHITYKTNDVELTVLDSRTTFSDKIAKFGGTFGLWAQLTGCSLIVLINLCVIFLKTIFHLCKSES